jgi:two-component system cell cycle response regulator
MLDLDDFKHINDSYGHLNGDKVLAKTGHVINKLIREMDLAARYGGEEIVVIMPGADLNHTQNAAERIRKSIEEMQFDDFSVTASIGISQYTPVTNKSETLIGAADKALYKAKQEGKNRVAKAT